MRRRRKLGQQMPGAMLPRKSARQVAAGGHHLAVGTKILIHGVDGAGPAGGRVLGETAVTAVLHEGGDAVESGGNEGQTGREILNYDEYMKEFKVEALSEGRPKRSIEASRETGVVFVDLPRLVQSLLDVVSQLH